jgi:hypothetical protein
MLQSILQYTKLPYCPARACKDLKRFVEEGRIPQGVSHLYELSQRFVTRGIFSVIRLVFPMGSVLFAAGAMLANAATPPLIEIRKSISMRVRQQFVCQRKWGKSESC